MVANNNHKNQLQMQQIFNNLNWYHFTCNNNPQLTYRNHRSKVWHWITIHTFLRIYTFYSYMYKWSTHDIESPIRTQHVLKEKECWLRKMVIDCCDCNNSVIIRDYKILYLIILIKNNSFLMYVLFYVKLTWPYEQCNSK